MIYEDFYYQLCLYEGYVYIPLCGYVRPLSSMSPIRQDIPVIVVVNDKKFNNGVYTTYLGHIKRNYDFNDGKVQIIDPVFSNKHCVYLDSSKRIMPLESTFEVGERYHYSVNNILIDVTCGAIEHSDRFIESDYCGTAGYFYITVIDRFSHSVLREFRQWLPIHRYLEGQRVVEKVSFYYNKKDKTVTTSLDK